MYRLTKVAEALLRDADLSEFHLLQEWYLPEQFGDALADFSRKNLILRFWCDRGDDRIEIASTENPTRFYQPEAVSVARGQSSIEDVKRKMTGVPRDLGTVWAELLPGLVWLETAFSGRDPAGLARLESANRLLTWNWSGL